MGGLPFINDLRMYEKFKNAWKVVYLGCLTHLFDPLEKSNSINIVLAYIIVCQMMCQTQSRKNTDSVLKKFRGKRMIQCQPGLMAHS